MIKSRYEKSNTYLNRALKVIPLGSQTFSKSITQYPYGVSPLFIEKGEGALVWDIDGNQYVDFVNALLCVNLGYRYKKVDEAVVKQLSERGVSFSLPHRIETLVAEKIVELVPCAEKVRFGKNGTDATSAAIRLSRAYTRREHVAVCGYHGWQDWYIGSTTKNEGVPHSTRKLTHKFEFNNIESLEKIFSESNGEIAAVILEPMNVSYPKDNFLQKVKDLCVKNGAVLVFDETITGFRFSRGGAQELFGVIPDLTTLGKGMGNGYPISAICGKSEIMNKMEDIFFSGTFGGETLSLVASYETLKIIQEENVPEKIKELGLYLIDKLESLIKELKLGEVFSVSGHPVWSFLVIKDYKAYTNLEIKSFLMQEMFKRGILSIGTHNLSYSHRREHVDSLIEAYRGAFFELSKGLNGDDLMKFFNGKVLEPLFKVR
ncbi:MAG: aspartate aminotransferase family protein [Halobacteriovoraceae bacterium]|nr:aspartate aminotransferase family protein [Halobacteriovoraceae bacterium]|tara:strand:+ start:17632 stop:18927 length:1296 start_codon:yes stop_codon:yes gene_type:complete